MKSARTKALPSRKTLQEILTYKEGELFWKPRATTLFAYSALGDAWNTRYANTKAGGKKPDGYVYINIFGIRYAAHRIIWAMHHDNLDGVIDHIDGDRSNNSLGNLRVCSHTENLRNSKLSKGNKFGLKGVSKNGTGFRATIVVAKKQKNLGTFATPEEAHQAYANAALFYFGNFANP